MKELCSHVFIKNSKTTCDPVETLKALFSTYEISIATSDGKEELIKPEQIHGTDGSGVIIIQAEEI